MKSQETINLVISTLGAGGAERVLTTMAAWWARRGDRVHLLTFASARLTPFYELHPGVLHEGLGILEESRGLLQRVLKNIRRLVRLRDAIRRLGDGPIISFGTETNCLVLLASLGLGRRIIVSERCDPRFIPQSRPWRWVRRLAYPLASSVVVQTQEAAAYFPRRLRTTVVPNPVLAQAQSAPANDAECWGEPGRGPMVVAMGRLTHQKGFDVLIKAFSAVAGRHPAWSLRILGEGPSRRSLEEAVEREGLGGRVSLPGVVAMPAHVLARADLFVLSSRYEGFPNALCEAMSCGLPVISTDCPSGPREIVRDGVDGRLVPSDDVPALARALDALMADPAMRAELGAHAREVARRFAVDDVMARWRALIQAAGGKDDEDRPA